MLVEAGKYYRNRSGVVVGPLRYRGAEYGTYSFICNLNTAYTEKGKVFSTTIDVSGDLIEEVPMPTTELSETFPQNQTSDCPGQGTPVESTVDPCTSSPMYLSIYIPGGLSVSLEMMAALQGVWNQYKDEMEGEELRSILIWFKSWGFFKTDNPD